MHTELRGLLRQVEKILKPDGQVLIVEPPFHVSRRAFVHTIKKANSAGLVVVDRPKLFLNKTALMKKNQVR